MGKQIAPASIAAPGFMGLNKQDAPVDMSPNFALEANNCVIDKSGRIASRKGWKTVHTANADLGTTAISCIGELIENNGASTILAAGGAFLFKLVGTTLTTLTYGGGGVAPVISASNWQFCQLNGVGIFFQRGYDPLIYEPAVSTTTFKRLSEQSGSIGTVQLSNCAISAYGRIWNADTTADKNTVQWSDVLAPHKWTGGTSGTLDLLGVWPVGGDEIVALAVHNNFLFIFGMKQVLIYSGADTPATMKLHDSIVNGGSIARDSVQMTSSDIIYLSYNGVRSIMRTIQEKSAPLRTISKNVNDDVIGYLQLENLSNVRSVYSLIEQFYLLTFPASGVTYCFDTRFPMEDGAARVTTWTSIEPKAFCEAKSGVLYFGTSGNVASHSGYNDNVDPYRMSYFTTWIDFGNPIQTSILKKAVLTLIGLSNQAVVFKWAYDFISNYYSQTTVLSGIAIPAEYGVAEYGIAEYSGNVSINTLVVQGSSSGKVMQFGLEAQVNGYHLSIQRIDLYSKDGRLQ